MHNKNQKINKIMKIIYKNNKINNKIKTKMKMKKMISKNNKNKSNKMISKIKNKIKIKIKKKIKIKTKIKNNKMRMHKVNKLRNNNNFDYDFFYVNYNQFIFCILEENYILLSSKKKY